jgi:hypothetical protein
MKKLFTLSFSIACLASFGQVFWTENFGTGCNQGTVASSYSGTNGAWTIASTGTNDNFANQWFVSATEAGMGVGQCGDGCLTTPVLNNGTLHLGNVAVPQVGLQADQGAAYNTGGICQSFMICVITNRRAESPLINCTNKNNISLTFLYFMNAQSGTDYASLSYSADGGATWNLIQNLTITPFGPCSPQGQWTAFTVVLPPGANNNPNVKIGFTWTNNDDGVGSDPSFAVDDITLSTAPTSVQTIDPSLISVFAVDNIIHVNGTDVKNVVAISDVLGKNISFTRPDQQSLQINVPTGIYFVQLVVEGQKMVKKILIK